MVLAKIFDFAVLTEWIDSTLSSFMPSWLTVLTECVLIGFALLLTYSVLALFYIYFCILYTTPSPRDR
ncbi:MAG: hypothetical protein K2J17_01610, partial [Paramuribaculum sp.]|nr:hypothetical protein [Paramuribaculum sp.]